MKAQKLNPSPDQVDRAAIEDPELLKVSREWSPEQWEQYLVTLEGPLKEELVHHDKYNRIKERADFCIFDLAQNTASPALIERVRKLIQHLTTRQQEVVDLIFFKANSERTVALELGITRSAVVNLKRRAVARLRRFLAEGVSTFPLVKGQENQTEESNA